MSDVNWQAIEKNEDIEDLEIQINTLTKQRDELREAAWDVIRDFGEYEIVKTPTTPEGRFSPSAAMVQTALISNLFAALASIEKDQT